MQGSEDTENIQMNDDDEEGVSAMKKILLSLLGLGRKTALPDGGSAYKRIAHQFQDGESILTSLSTYAFLEKSDESFSHVYVFGTYTSSWSALLEELPIIDDISVSELYYTIEEEQLAGGISKNSLAEMERILSGYWKTRFYCYAHREKIAESSIEEVFLLYQSAILTIPQDTDSIVFDITHGFRTMPLLMLSALQYWENFSGRSAKLHMYYVELQDNTAAVREITPIYTQGECSKAVRMFIDKFDGSSLTELTREFWDRGAKVIDRLSFNIQSNAVSSLVPFIKGQLKNAIAEGAKMEFPHWFIPVYEWLERLFRKLDQELVCLTMLQVSKLMLDRSLYGQSVITLHVAFQVFLHEFYDEQESMGDWDMFKLLRDRFLSDTAVIDYKTRQRLIEIERLRNSIAHGGSGFGNNASQFSEALPKKIDHHIAFLGNLIADTLE
jgi:CRISPR-associated DxTHG motif protein